MLWMLHLYEVWKSSSTKLWQLVDMVSKCKEDHSIRNICLCFPQNAVLVLIRFGSCRYYMLKFGTRRCPNIIKDFKIGYKSGCNISIYKTFVKDPCPHEHTNGQNERVLVYKSWMHVFVQIFNNFFGLLIRYITSLK